MEGCRHGRNVNPTLQHTAMPQPLLCPSSVSPINQDSKENKEDISDGKIVSHTELKRVFQEASQDMKQNKENNSGDQILSHTELESFSQDTKQNKEDIRGDQILSHTELESFSQDTKQNKEDISGELESFSQDTKQIQEDIRGDQILSHAELKRYFQESLSRLLESDPLLSDLHPQVTLEEVKALNELEHGRAMKVYVERADGGMWGVVVPREATLRGLKEALRRHVALALARQGVRRKVSWRYVWRSSWLAWDGETLRNDNAKLLELGVRHKSCLTFVKRRREKGRKRVDRGGR